MPLPIITTKLQMPRLPAGHVRRSRLADLLTPPEEVRLVSVTAGAGWGKSSSLVAAATACRRRLLWYTLDDDDRHLEVFMAHLAHAQGLEASGLQEGLFLASLVAAWRQEPRGVVLVLDDAQRLGDGGAVPEFIARLVRHLPARCTVVVASREPLNLPVSRYEALGQARRLVPRDLAFTPEEILVWWRALQPGVDPTEEQLSRLARRTEGWAAGLQLFFQVAARSGFAQVEEDLARLAGAGAGWFAYFAEEVLASQDAPTRDFLLRTSIFPRLEADLCDRLPGIRDSRARLADLADRNLFTFSVGDARREWRYHHLFREFLLTNLAERAGTEELQKMRRRAGRILERAGHRVDALVVLADSRDPVPALELMAKGADRLLESGRFHDLSRALEKLEPRVVRSSGAALYLQGHVCSLHGRWEKAEESWRGALRRRPSPSRRVELQSLLAQLHMRSGRFRKCLDICRRTLGTGEGLTRRSEARLLGWRGVSHCALGNLKRGEADLLAAMRLSRQVRDRRDEGRLLFLLAANVQHIQGRCREAEEAARRALGLFRDLDDRQMVCHSLGVLGFVLIGAGRFPEGESYSRDALRQAQSLGYRNIEGYANLNLGCCALHADDPLAGREHFRLSLDIGRELGEASLQALARTGEALALGALGQGSAADEVAGAALGEATEGGDLWPASQAALALGFLRGRESAGRREAWREAERLLTRLGASLDLARLALWRLLDEDAARPAWGYRLAAFMAGLQTAGQGFLLTRLEPGSARALREKAETEAGEGVWDPAWDAFAPAPAEEQVATEVSFRAGPVLRIEALGPLVVRASDRVLERRHWRSARALRLLGAMLVRRLRWTPREEIMEALWPEVDPGRGANNLRQSLHLLRRLVFTGGESPVLISRDEMIGPDPALDLSCDILEFEEARALGAVRQRQGQATETLAALGAAVELYRGPLLLDAPPADFIDEERDRLQLANLRVAVRFLHLLEEKGMWDAGVSICRRLVPLYPGEDSLAEWQLRAYLRLGLRGEALAAYRTYEKELARRWDLLPTEAMRLLAEKAARL